MFYYYGRKKKLAGLYPDPQHDTVIEPFAGSAAYSLHGNRWQNQVLLVEKDPKVVDLWSWLIEDATPDSVLALPDPEVGERTDVFLILLSMASKRAFSYRSCKMTPFMKSAWTANRKYIAHNLHKVKHWKIIEGDYTMAPDVEATWFVDPPYRGEPGSGYRFGSSEIDYDALGEWCLSRRGALIACEGGGADWLPFEPLVVQAGAAGKRNEEVIYTRGFVDALSMFYSDTRS
jgi:hypothetical protein